MIISDEQSRPILIDSIDVPTITEDFWVLDLSLKDFILTKLVMFEELHTPTLSIKILDYIVEIPTYWNILIYSSETSQLDITQVSDLTRNDFNVLVFNHKTNAVIEGKSIAVDYKPISKICSPSLQKNMMLCHALGPNMWIMVSPSDNYNKYIRDAVIGDLF